MAMKSAKLAHCAPRKIADAVAAHMPEGTPPSPRSRWPAPASSTSTLTPPPTTRCSTRQAGHGLRQLNVGQGLRTPGSSSSPPTCWPHARRPRPLGGAATSLCRVKRVTPAMTSSASFYINDGSQMDVFGNSISYRYMQLIEIMEKEGLDIDGARDFPRTATTTSRTSREHRLPPLHGRLWGLGGNAYGGTYIIDEAAASTRRTATGPCHG